MDIQQLSNLMKNLEVSPVEVVQTFLDRIDKYDSKINSFISVFSQESIKEAKRIEKLFLNKEIGLASLTMQLLIVFFNLLIFTISLRENKKALTESMNNIIDEEEIVH